MKNEALDYLISICKPILAKSQSNITMADCDIVDVALEQLGTDIPKKIHDVAASAARNTDYYRQELVRRVYYMAIQYSEIPEELVSSTSSTGGLIPVFQLHEEEAARVTELCHEMRKIVLAATQFDQPHKVRLLNRIAAIEQEIQKPQGMFDVVRGGLSDLGETLGKFGTDIKPLTDRMREVVGIARKNTDEYDQLPPPEEIPELPHPSDFEEDAE